MIRSIRVATLVLLVLIPALYGALAVAQGTVAGGSRDWNGWSFDYEVSGYRDGLSLENVRYQGVAVLNKASFPVMRVFYEGSPQPVCGPYADRLGGIVQPVGWANNALLVSRQFDQGGRTWLELGIQDEIGNYLIYQAWYLSTDGLLDGHVFSKGIQCYVDGDRRPANHVHYPYWRLDIDVSGDDNDQIRRFSGGSWQAYATEFEAAATAASDHRWQVRDTVTGASVDVRFGVTSLTDLDYPVAPLSGYANNKVYGYRYRDSEDVGWRWGAGAEGSEPFNAISPPFNNGEGIDGQDIVLWYKGYLPHQPEEGEETWHSTGVRMIFNAAASENRPPTIDNPGPQSSTEGSAVALAIGASDPDGDSLSYSAAGLPDGLSIARSSGRIAGTLATGSAGSYSVAVTVSDGETSASAEFAWSVGATGDLTLLRADFNDDTDGFRYVDDAFRGTATSRYASGRREQSGGYSGGALSVRLGGQNDDDIFGLSGGWQASFNLVSTQQATLSLRYRLDLAADYESDEYGQALLRIDGDVYGNGGADYLAQLSGDGDGGSAQTTGWRVFQSDLGRLSAGSHTVVVGAYNNKKTYNNEVTEVWIDDVVITAAVSGGGGLSLSNPGAQRNAEGDSVTLQIRASATEPLSYSASGLPPGLAIGSSSGVIAGTVSLGGAGAYAPTVGASDGRNSDSVRFDWNVSEPVSDPPTTIRYDFEGGSDWTANPSASDTAVTGAWSRSNPERTTSGGVLMQLGDTADGQYALVTDGRDGRSGGTYDIDGGVTSVRSPSIDLSGASQVSLSFAYYLAHRDNATTADFLRVRVIGTSTQTVFEERGAGDFDAAAWSSTTVDLSDFAGQTVNLLIEAADQAGASLVEAAVDGITISIAR